MKAFLKIIVVIVGIVTALLVLSLLMPYALNSNNNSQNQTSTNPVSSTIPSDWKTYSNQYFNYALEYPNRYQVSYQNSDTRRNFLTIELRKEYYPQEKDTNFVGASIGVIASVAAQNGLNAECNPNYPSSTVANKTTKVINGVNFNAGGPGTSTSDLEDHLFTDVYYQYNDVDVCLLLSGHIDQKTEDISTHQKFAALSQSELQKLITELESIIYTFKFTK